MMLVKVVGARLPIACSKTAHIRRMAITTPAYAAKRRVEDEIHRPSLSGSSVGHLIAEISSMKPGMESLRPEGHTMSEEQRTFARRVVTWTMGLPVLLGAIFVGGRWALQEADET